MNVFVIGHDEYQAKLLERTVAPEDEEYVFHSLIPTKALRGGDEFSPPALVREAKARLESFDGPVNALVTFTDFPAIEITALLGESQGLPTPSFRGVLRSSHKYWSRTIQRKVARQHVPSFTAVNPWEEFSISRIGLRPPFWIKPFNAHRSYLAFRIRRRKDLDAAIPRFQSELPRLAVHLRWLLERAGDLSELEGVAPDHCLAEAVIGGRQCTVEGYVYRGEPRVYGVVDTVRFRGRPSFARYQYPSTLPGRIKERIVDIALRLMGEIGLENGAFNIEFFWDRPTGRLWILEVNPRISQSHCELFEKVDGQSHQKVSLDLALGRAPDPPRREGRHLVAGKFFVRVFEDATVRRVPGATERERLEEELPGATLILHVSEGSRLSEMHDQDVYSYELAWLWLGAADQKDLLHSYRRALEILDFRLEYPDGRVERVGAS